MSAKTQDALAADRLAEIKGEISDLMDEARRLVRGTSEASRAMAYWYPHIVCALDEHDGYLGSSMCTMQETIDALRKEDDTNEEEGE